ncbi:aquaporin-like protein [Trametes versicolor FP-101664 SS1]|uniref:aquaporin-like protein n=1 Tax=Trametes versicolor (strain FP-101664) TaxID=717944 RepID=UPI00046234BF|nr:aquaporin-like protein [Trametes versicolor FP-101664 SS1]EIW63166.1 aquaporin-like protein [Trametes versicolor FP-101664 SS1]
MTAAAGTHHLRQREFVHLADIKPRSSGHIAWERRRHRQAHWLVECLAEFMGVFFYVYAGVGSTASYLLANTAQLNGLGSLFQIGTAYAFGILFALIVCAPTSGGHFNPAMTIAFTLMGRCTWKKALRYFVAQILGAYVACLLIYVQWHDLIEEASEILAAAGKLDAVMFTANGPAGVFALYVPPGTNLGRVFLNEFVCDFIIGLVIWSCMDPTNFGASPVSAPWIVAFAYAVVVWGYSPVGVATNAARDVGSRLMAMTIWGMPASGGSYAAIAALTNIPATLLAAVFYEVVLADSSRVVTPAHVDYLSGHLAHEEHSQGIVRGGSVSPGLDEKSREQTIEHV